MIRSRRFMLASAVVVLGLAATACGDDRRTTGATTSESSAAPPVVHLGGASAVVGAETAAADRMMMPYGQVVYVFDGELPELAGSAHAWRFPAGAQPDAARIATIARVLGVEGEVRALPADQGGGWMVGPADYSGATLTVSADGMLSWWFSPSPSAGIGVACAVPEAVPADTVGETTGGGSDSSGGDVRCVEPEPPAGVPDDAAALELARSLYGGLGYDAESLDYEVYADEWGASVTAFVMLDGERSPLSFSVGFGGEGEVTWASGFLGEPELAGEYPLVGTAAGLERMQDETGRWLWFGVGARMDTATTSAGAAEGAPTPVPVETTPVDTIAVDTIPVDTTPVETVPVDTIPVDTIPVETVPVDTIPMEIIEVHLTDVHLGLTMIWDVDGTVWLLPAYVFTSADGGEYAVIAVDDRFVELPEALPVPEPLPAETIGEPSPDPSIIDPLPAEVDLSDAAELVGLTEDEAAKVAAERGWSFRVARADGVDFAVTADYSPTRVNVALEEGVVTEVVSIG